MTYESIRKPEPGKPYKHTSSDLQKWIYDDCSVVECIDGNIFKEIDGYSTLYNCPKCFRTTVTPGKRIWRGEITERTVEDMERRREERRELVFNREERYKRAKEIVGMLHDICKPIERIEPKVQPQKDLPPGTMTKDELIEAARSYRAKTK